VSITLIFGPLFAKIWRVNGIFNATKLSKVHVAKDAELFAGVGAMLAVDALLLGAWTGANPLEATTETLPLELRGNDLIGQPYYYKCTGENTDVWLALVISYKVALMVVGAGLAYKTRRVTIPALNDAKWVGFAVYNWLIALAFGLPVAVMLQDEPTAAYAMTSAAMLFAVVGTLALVHGPKLLAIATGTEAAWTATGGGGTAVTAAGSGSATPARSARKSKATPAGKSTVGPLPASRSRRADVSGAGNRHKGEGETELSVTSTSRVVVASGKRSSFVPSRTSRRSSQSPRLAPLDPVSPRSPASTSVTSRTGEPLTLGHSESS
jgi:7 transmembrane sweet-taste receptor of 3 GCPR